MRDVAKDAGEGGVHEGESGFIEELGYAELAKIFSDDGLDDIEGDKKALFVPGERWVAEGEVRELRRERFNGEWE